MAACLIAGCAPRPAPVQSNNARELIVGFPGAHVAGADNGIGQFISMLSVEGLTWGNVDGRSIPRLAESWEWERDGRQLRLHLRPDVFFHDGTELTAPVVVDILTRTLARPNVADAYSSFDDVTSVRADGKLQVVVELSRPSAFLPEDLDMPLAIRPSVGTGPFRLLEREATEATFERFERYYQGVPPIERIQMKAFDAHRTAWSSLLRNELDMVTDVPAEAIEFVQTDEVGVLRYRRRYQYMILLNSRRPALSTPAVRRALNLAVDRKSLIERALRGYGTPATGPLWPQHWAYDTSAPSFGFDLRSAVTLLDRAGFPLGAARGRSNVPHARLTFTCLLPEGFSVIERLGLEVQKQLYDAGVDLQFEVVPTDQFETRLREGRFEAVLIDMISGPSFGRPYIFWRSAKHFDGLNQFGWENPEAERLFELLRASALNETATRSATNRLQRVFLEDPPALFLAWSERARVVGPRYAPVIDPERDPVLTMWRWTPADRRRAER